mgnify:CR=1 FL=1
MTVVPALGLIQTLTEALKAIRLFTKEKLQECAHCAEV